MSEKQISPNVYEDGVPWCDSACEHYDRETCGCKIDAEMTASEMLCMPFIKRAKTNEDRLTSELEAARAQVAKCEEEIRDGDYWHQRVTQALANGTCPVCFTSDEAGHTEECPWGQAERDLDEAREALQPAVDHADKEAEESRATFKVMTNQAYESGVQIGELTEQLRQEREVVKGRDITIENIQSQWASFTDCINTFAREEGTAQCDALDADLRPWFSTVVYALRRRLHDSRLAQHDANGYLKLAEEERDRLKEELRAAKRELAQWKGKAQSTFVDLLHTTGERDVVANERDRLMEELEAMRTDRDRWKAAAGRLEVLAKRLAVSYSEWAGGGVGADCLAEIAAALAGTEGEATPEQAKEAGTLTKEEKAEVDYWRTVNRDMPLRSTTDLLSIIDRLTGGNRT